MTAGINAFSALRRTRESTLTSPQLCHAVALIPFSGAFPRATVSCPSARRSYYHHGTFSSCQGKDTFRSFASNSTSLSLSHCPSCSPVSPLLFPQPAPQLGYPDHRHPYSEIIYEKSQA